MRRETQEEENAAKEGLAAAAVWRGDEDGQRVAANPHRLCRWSCGSRAGPILIRPIRGKLHFAASGSFFFSVAFLLTPPTPTPPKEL